MLKDFVKAIEPEEEELRKELKEAQAKLAGFQTRRRSKRPSFLLWSFLKDGVQPARAASSGA